MVYSYLLQIWSVGYDYGEKGIKYENGFGATGEGTGNRYKKDSFEWYKKVIASNGEDL